MENEKNREQYYGYERLVSLGGFIGAKAKSILYGLTTEGVRGFRTLRVRKETEIR